MKNIDKFNKYYGTNYDIKKITYCLVIFIFIINFFFAPVSFADANLDLNSNTNPINNQENPTPILPSQNKESNEQEPIVNDKSEKKDINSENKKDADSKQKANDEKENKKNNNDNKVEEEKDNKQENKVNKKAATPAAPW